MLRPELTRVPLTGGEVRWVFGLVRPNKTRKVYASVTRLRRRSYPNQTWTSPRGFEVELKVFS